MAQIKVGYVSSKRYVKVNKGDPLLVYTKGKHTCVVFGFFKSVRESESIVRGGNLTNAQWVYLEEACYLREPLTIKGSKIPYVFIPPNTLQRNRISIWDKSLEDMIVGQESIVDHLRKKGEDWKPYADWISKMQID